MAKLLELHPYLEHPLQMRAISPLEAWNLDLVLTETQQPTAQDWRTLAWLKLLHRSVELMQVQ
jgi:hypothetical protein